MGVLIASTFRAALVEALASLPSTIASTPGAAITAAELQRYMEVSGPMIRAIADDVLEVIAEIQRHRDREPGFDQYLRQRGIVTRIRSVR